MRKNFKWEETLKNELMDFFKEGLDKKYSISQISRDFANKHSDIKPSQAQMAYYRFLKENNKSIPKEKKAVKTVKKGSWSKVENNQLIELVDRNKNDVSTALEEFSKSTGRPYKNVYQHYYMLKKNNENDIKFKETKKSKKSNKSINVDEDVIKKLNRMPTNIYEAFVAIIDSI